MKNLADTFAFWRKQLQADKRTLQSQDQEALRKDFLKKRRDFRRFLSHWTANLLPDSPGVEAVDRLAFCGAIDQIFSHVGNGSIPQSLGDYLDPCKNQLEKYGYYNTDTALGLVVPRRPLHGYFADAFENELPHVGEIATDWLEQLLWLPPEIAACNPDGPEGRTVSLQYRLVPDEQVKTFLTTEWKVAFIPVAQDPSEYELKGFDDQNGQPVYSIIPADGSEARLANRVQQAIIRACDEGCHIVAMPELVMTHALHHRVEMTLKGLTDRQRENLLLVLAGTRLGTAMNGNGPTNEAVVFDHAGKPILIQHKLSRWDLESRQSEIYGIDRRGCGRSRFEHLTLGTSIDIVEYPQLGRIAVLICEDLRKTEPGKWLRANMALELQFTPVLSQGLDWVYNSHPGDDHGQGGRGTVTVGRCRLISANSMFMRTRLNVLNRREEELRCYVKDQVEVGVLMERGSKEESCIVAEIELASDGTLVSEPLVEIRAFGKT